MNNGVRTFFGAIYIAYLSISTAIGLSFTIIPLFPLHFIFPVLFRSVCDFMMYSWICANVKLMGLFGTKLFVYSETDDLNQPSLIIMNHKNRLDWFIYFLFSVYYQDPRKLKIALKNSLRSVPFFGWACQLGCYLFLRRDWEKDKIKLNKYLQYFKSLQWDQQLLIFCEGTNFCPESKEASDKYAKMNDLPSYNFVLHPRVTGFKYLVRQFDGTHGPNIKCVYDVTVGYKGEAYGETDILTGNFTKEVHLHIERIDLSALPESDEDLDIWLKKRWETKEKSLESFYQIGHFSNNPPLQPQPHRDLSSQIFIYNLVVVIGFYFLYTNRFVLVYFLLQTVACFLISKYIGFDNLIINHFA
uniref:Lysocardiolipin acyltransferase 1 (Trinotate prediction) n=1 Tax=Myxobolus squamalis TaxID=59785 RepID=A0A6B2FXB5_MYXSQ